MEPAYDQRNFITSKASVGDSLSYNYDLNGQLISTTSANNPASKNEVFSYDSLGNRSADQNQIYTYTESGQRLTDDSLFTYLYDNNGNILSKSSKSNTTSYLFEYSTSNQLKKIMVLDRPLGTLQKTIEFFYDAMGRRFKKQLTDHTNSSNNYIRKYIYDGDNILAELDDSNRLLASYTHSPLAPDDVLSVHFTNHAVSSSQGGDAINAQSVLSPAIGNYYFLKDQINSITAIANNQGQIVQSYEYSSFGKIFDVKNSSGVSINFQQASFRTSFTFTGREFEPETGLYYYRARYYDPRTGRFLQQDPHPGQLNNPKTLLNKYVYCGGNPIMYNDPTGEFFNILFSSAIFGVLGDGAQKLSLKLLVGGMSLFAGIYTGGMAAGFFGFSAGTLGGFLTSAIFGAVGGGITGAFAFPALGLGNSEEGFLFGAVAGAIGGALAGAGAFGSYRVTKYQAGKIVDSIEQGFSDVVDSFASAGSQKAKVAQLISRGSPLANYFAIAEPYVLGIGGGIYVNSVAYNCTVGRCSIPKVPIADEKF